MWEETGHATKRDLINEVQTLIERLVLVKHLLRDNEAEFVLNVEAKLKQYGEGAFISAKQLFWLRDLEQRYVPDPRQMSLL